MDAFLIAQCQRMSLMSKPVLFLSLLLTLVTTIEIGTTAPLVLLAFGLDDLAHSATLLVLMLAFTSQLPKRFIFRKRPYVVGRALTVRADATSSFPSRAVTCAAVYTFFLARSLAPAAGTGAVVGWMLAAALLASFARVNLGVHYPSDCFVGILQGAVVCVAGTLLANATPPPQYSTAATAAAPQNSQWHISGWSDGTCSWGIFAAALAICTLVQIACVCPPLSFWVKSHHCFGLLFSALLFQYMLLYPPLHPHGSSLRQPSAESQTGWRPVLVAAGLVAFTMGVGLRWRGTSVLASVLALLTLMLGSFFSLGTFRIYTQS